MSNTIKLLLIHFLLPLICFSQTQESWVGKPKSEEPQIAPTNGIQYKNGDRYYIYAGTGFLMDTGKNTVGTRLLSSCHGKALGVMGINTQKTTTTDILKSDKFIEENMALFIFRLTMEIHGKTKARECLKI